MEELSTVECGEDQAPYLGMKTPFRGNWLIGPGQAVCDHVEAAQNVSGPESYVL